MNAVFVDRDGVINEDSDAYIKNPAEWHPIPGSLEAIADLNRSGIPVLIASNQSAIARGLITIDDLNGIHQKMVQSLNQIGGHIDAILFCPHGPDDGCRCRKPKPGMLLEGALRLDFDLKDSIFIGDSLADLQAAHSVGAKAVLVRTGNGKKTEAILEDYPPISVYDDLAAAVASLLATKEKKS